MLPCGTTPLPKIRSCVYHESFGCETNSGNRAAYTGNALPELILANPLTCKSFCR